MEPSLRDCTDDQLRAEARRRGYDLHSRAFSAAAQQALRELEAIRDRANTLIDRLTSEGS